jgi:hypothetical protein
MITPILSAQINGAKPSSIPVHDFSVKGGVLGTLNEIAEKFHVVIGVYGDFANHKEPTIDIAIKTGTLKDVFNAVTKPIRNWNGMRAITASSIL